MENKIKTETSKIIIKEIKNNKLNKDKRRTWLSLLFDLCRLFYKNK